MLYVLMLRLVLILTQNIFQSVHQRQRVMIILEHGHNFSHNDLENNGIMSQGKKKKQECFLSPAGNGPFNITLSSIALISIVTRPHSAIGLQNCFPQQHPISSYLLSQMAGQTAFLSIARLISSVSRGSLASSGQEGLQWISQCN